MNAHSSNQLASMANVQHGMSPVAPCFDEAVQRPLDAAGERTLEAIGLHGRSLVEQLEDLLDVEQEQFMNHLRRHLGDPATCEEKLHFSLNADGQLIVEGENSASEDLCQVVAEIPALQEDFQRLAKLALLSHGLDIACQAQAGLEQDGLDNPLFSRFHMSLKGSFSHFFVR